MDWIQGSEEAGIQASKVIWSDIKMKIEINHMFGASISIEIREAEF